MGDNKAQVIMNRFPKRDNLTDFLATTAVKQAVKELASLELVGKVLAERILQVFATPKVAVVTPPSRAKATTTPKRRNYDDDDDDDYDNQHRKKRPRRLFDTGSATVSTPASTRRRPLPNSNSDSSSNDDSQLNGERKKRPILVDNPQSAVKRPNLLESDSSDDISNDELYQPPSAPGSTGSHRPSLSSKERLALLQSDSSDDEELFWDPFDRTKWKRRLEGDALAPTAPTNKSSPTTTSPAKGSALTTAATANTTGQQTQRREFRRSRKKRPIPDDSYVIEID
eukprot:Sro1771_g296660.2  (284) ;mRNA; r:19377-20228